MMSKYHLLIPLVLAACADPSPASPDGGTSDGALPDGAASDAEATDGPRDGGRPDTGWTFDGNELRDATTPDGSGDESIRGTTLEGITIPWDQPIDLCTRWQEGRPIADERAAKAWVSLWPAPRASLGSGDLGHAVLGRVIARRGPFSGDQWAPKASSSALVSYEVRRQGGADSVSAEIEHDLGPAGVLVESFSVYRASGDTRPVRIGDGLFEHGFSLRRQDLADPLILLEPCAGSPDLEDGVHVLTARRGADSVTLVRYARTADAVAGSAPVIVRSLDVRRADMTYRADAIADFWAMTYAAEHHNWNDTSHYDFSRDLAHWAGSFGPWERTGDAGVASALEAVDLRQIDGWDGPPEVDLVWRDFAANMTRTETWAANRNWLRVDATALGRQLDCPGARVSELDDDGAHVFQVLLCPRSAEPGFEVRGVVPVVFPEEVDTVGHLQDHVSAGTFDGHPGYAVTAGGHTILLTGGWGSDFIGLELRASDGTTSGQTLDNPGTLWVVDPDSRVRAGRGEMSLTFVRRWVSLGAGVSSVFALASVDAAVGAQSWHVEAWDALEYTNTHHNWQDTFVAHAEGATLYWRTDPSDGHYLRIVSADGSVLLPETELDEQP